MRRFMALYVLVLVLMSVVYGACSYESRLTDELCFEGVWHKTSGDRDNGVQPQDRFLMVAEGSATLRIGQVRNVYRQGPYVSSTSLMSESVCDYDTGVVIEGITLSAGLDDLLENDFSSNRLDFTTGEADYVTGTVTVHTSMGDVDIAAGVAAAQERHVSLSGYTDRYRLESHLVWLTRYHTEHLMAGAVAGVGIVYDDSYMAMMRGTREWFTNDPWTVEGHHVLRFPYVESYVRYHWADMYRVRVTPEPGRYTVRIRLDDFETRTITVVPHEDVLGVRLCVNAVCNIRDMPIDDVVPREEGDDIGMIIDIDTHFVTHNNAEVAGIPEDYRVDLPEGWTNVTPEYAEAGSTFKRIDVSNGPSSGTITVHWLGKSTSFDVILRPR